METRDPSHGTEEPSAEGSSAVEFPVPDVLDRYVRGMSDVAEREAVDAWIATLPARRAWIRTLQTVAVDTVEAMPDDQARAWSEAVRARDMAARLEGVQRQAPPRQTKFKDNVISPWRHAWGGRLGGAIAALGLLVTAVYWGAQATTSASPTIARYATAAGQRATIALGDGSRIILAPQSSITVTRDTHGPGRTIQLSGEAYFDVHPSATTPFVVRVAGIDVRVLGTSFDVRRYSSDRATRIVVSSGKVAVARRDAAGTHTPVIVPTGMIAMANDSTITTSPATDALQYTVWTTGHLVFTNAAVTDVLETVGRWCGYTFQLNDSTLASRHVNAVLVTGERTTMLTMLQDLLNVTMTFHDSTVTLHPRRDTPTGAGTRIPHVRDTLSPLSEVGR